MSNIRSTECDLSVQWYFYCIKVLLFSQLWVCYGCGFLNLVYLILLLNLNAPNGLVC